VWRLGLWFTHYFFSLNAFVGAGLIFEGATDWWDGNDDRLFTVEPAGSTVEKSTIQKCQKRILLFP
jgi:hypothetical protein